MPKDLEYIAGFVDGEGCLSTPKVSRSTSIQLSAVNLDLAVLQYIQTTLQVGQIVCPRPAAPRPWHMWRCINAAQTFHALSVLYPYLVIKRAEAWYAMHLADHIVRRVGRSGVALTDEERSIRLQMANNISQIKRGINKDRPHQPIVSLPYIAGLFDAEGSICVLTRERYDAPIVHLHLTNTYIPSLYSVQHSLKVGRITVLQRSTPHRKVIGQWVLTGAERVQSLLTDLQPYIRVKSRQVEIALELLDRIIRRTGRPNHRLLPEERAERIRLANELKACRH